MACPFETVEGDELSDYWVAAWLESRGLTSIEAVRIRIAGNDGFEEVVDSAAEAQQLPLIAPAGKNFVAGTGSDLSTHFSCNELECVKKSIERLVRHGWLFFDHVIVIGLDPVDFLAEVSVDSDQARKSFAHAVEVYLYIISSGIRSFFRFSRGLHYCTEHLNQHARDAGLQSVADMTEAIEADMFSRGELQLRNISSGNKWVFRHPALNTLTIGSADPHLTIDDLRPKIADHIARRLVASLTRSVNLSRYTNSTLGQFALTNSEMKLLPASSEGVRAGRVALNVSLPVFADAPASKLLEFRAKEPEEFEVFRAALLRTIQERIKLADGADADEIARQVVEDVLNPSLAALDIRSKKSAKLLGVRSAGAFAVGGMMTTIGLLSFSPLTLPGLVLATGAVVANWADYLKDQREVGLNDLHFLWRAGKSMHG